MQNLKADLLFINNLIKDIYKVKKFSQFIKYIDKKIFDFSQKVVKIDNTERYCAIHRVYNICAKNSL